MDSLVKYNTIEKYGKGFYKEKGSKFLGFIHPIHNEKEIKTILEQYKKDYHDARHHCYATTVGINQPIERKNDDGEPSGTAGKPILGQIHSFELSNVLIIVVRYFGGTKLGISGLINAYKTAAREAILDTTIIEKELKNCFNLSIDFSEIGNLLSLLKQQKIDHHDIAMKERGYVTIELPFESSNNILEQLKQNFKTIIINQIQYNEQN